MEPISRDELDAAWLAGIIDGEGHIAFARNEARGHRVSKVCVGNTDPRMIQRISQILARWGVKFWYQLEANSRRYKGAREFLILGVAGNLSVSKLLVRIIPHMTAKRDQAEALHEYLIWRNQTNLKGPQPDPIAFLEKQIQTAQRIDELRHRRFGLQRLPRGASVPLDLSRLEIMV